MFKRLQTLLAKANTILIVIANNPDADSVSSALALANIMQDLGKKAWLYCQVDIPIYLHFLTQWQQISKNLPESYDLALMVDNSSSTLLASPQDNLLNRLKQQPLVILDHHATESDISWATVYNNPEMVATGQLIYVISKELSWPLNLETANLLAVSILSDSLGFNSQSMTGNSQPLRIVADLVDLGVDLSELNDRRLKWQQIPASYVSYKADLLRRIQFCHKDQIAYLVVGHQEIKERSSIFNPTIILDEMRSVETVRVTLGFKQYQDRLENVNRITLRIRCHNQSQIAQDLAEKFGGGGHPYAAGVKWESQDLDITDIRDQVLKTAADLLK